MKGHFFINCLMAAVILAMTSCNDSLEEIAKIENDNQGNAVWHSPEVLTRAQTLRYFLRDHAVGYSYNAMTGDSYSLNDVRCQVVNRAELDAVDYISYTIDSVQKVRMEGDVYHSFTEYVHNTNLRATAKAKISLIAGGEAKAKCRIFEDGTTDSYIITSESKISSGNYRMDVSGIMRLAKKHPSVLTPSFRDAIRQVAEANENNYRACVDSFIHTYGTHVVTYAEMGGSLSVLLQLDAKRYKTIHKLDAELTADAFQGMVKAKMDGSSNSDGYKYLEDSKCYVKALGGNVSILDKLTNMNYYKIGQLEESVFTDWLASVRFDAEDFEKSTASVICMDFVPIYNFILDSIAQRRIRSVLEGSTQDLIEMLGNRNFVNVSFPYNQQTISYTLGNSTTKSCTSPEVTDLIYAGRHVATICRELIPEIDSIRNVRVVYPIYEGRIQQFNGLCLHNGRSYSVAWNEDKCTVTDKGICTDSTYVYITAGVPSFTKYTNISYNKAHMLPYIETDTPFKVDGSYNSAAIQYFTKKDKGYFYLPETKGNRSITGIPNWAYDENAGMMRRLDKYVYVYNPNELKYND